MGAVSLTASKAKYHAGLTPLVSAVHHAPYGHETDLAWFEEVLFDKLVPADEVAAIMVEPVQGEGGYIVPEAGFITGLRALCDRYGILLIADEIQSGAGRTGRMWAIEHFGVEPDILLSAKGLASGMPLAAMVARAEIMEAWGKGAHGSTYGGNPVACAAALSTIELLQDGLIENAEARGRQGRAALEAIAAGHPELVVETRGLGLMLALELATPEQAEAVEYEAFTRGLLVLGCGHKSVRLSPPLIIDEATMASGLDVLAEAVAAVAARAR
jgi:4-aminobutyrate aminotransferase